MNHFKINKEKKFILFKEKIDKEDLIIKIKNKNKII